MADVQLENGYTKIANMILDALIATDISGQALRIALLIIRKTYGFNKTEDAVSLSQMVKATGKSKTRCSQVVRRLELMNILTVTENINGIGKKYKFNKDFEQWKTVNKNINRYEKVKETVNKKRNRPLMKTLTTKETITKETITKENIQKRVSTGEKRKRFIPPSTEEVIKYCMERGNSVNPHAFLDFYQAKNWMIGKNKMKDWRAAIRTWEQRDGGNNGTQRASPQPITYRQAQDMERRKLAQLLKEDRKRGGFTDNSKGVSQAGAHLPEPTKGSG